MSSSVTRSLKSTSSPAAKHAAVCLSPGNTGKGSIRSPQLSPTANESASVNGRSECHDNRNEGEYVSNPAVSRGRRGRHDPAEPAAKEKFAQCPDADGDGDVAS